MPLAFILSPLLVLSAGALLLMLVEAFSKRNSERLRERQGGAAPQGAAGGLALGTAIVFGAGFVFSIAAWLYGVEDVPDKDLLAPWLVIDRFTIFFDALLCFSGAIASLLAGGYLQEHRLERGE